MEELNKTNYKTNHEYMSYSTLSKYMTCEAKAAARFYEPSSTAQLVGSYIDAYFSNELDEFKVDHPEIFNSRTGLLKSDFSQADEIIARVESDPIFMRALSGEKQRIMTGEIDGMKFKIKIDSYNIHKSIVDLKVMKDFKKVWSDAYGKYVNFIEGYDYDIEMALFQEIVYQNIGEKLPCFIAAVTKETPSDIGIFEIDQEQLDYALELIKQRIPEIKAIQDGKRAPHRCEQCAYCRGTKKASIISWKFVGYNGNQLREEGFNCDDPIIDNKKEEAK